MKARLRHHNQSTINTIHLLHLGRRTIRLVSETDFAFLSAIEKTISPWCSAARSLLLRDAAVAPLAPVHPVKSTMRRGITRRSTPATTDWENAAPGCVCSGEQYWHRSHQLHDRGDLEDLGLLLINEAKSQSCLWVPCVRPAVWLSVGCGSADSMCPQTSPQPSPGSERQFTIRGLHRSLFCLEIVPWPVIRLQHRGSAAKRR
jgi:hypothetical protein